MTNQKTGPATEDGIPAAGLTSAEKLTALQTYLKALKPMEEALRQEVTHDFGTRRVEKVGAYLPDGEKIGSVAYRPGNKSAAVTDSAAALRWALERHPEAVVQAVSPAFLKALTDHAAKVGEPGDPGVDPETGEALPFITVRQGAPYVAVTTTKEGVARMTQLAHGFAGMLEAPTPASERLDARMRAARDAMQEHLDATIDPHERLEELLHVAKVTVVPADDYDPDFADRLMNGAYEK